MSFTIPASSPMLSAQLAGGDSMKDCGAGVRLDGAGGVEQLERARDAQHDQPDADAGLTESWAVKSAVDAFMSSLSNSQNVGKLDRKSVV